MNKREFMSKLDYYLRDLDYQDKKDVFSYYEEYFLELRIGDYDEIPSDMNISKIASDILLEYNSDGKKSKKTKTLRSIFLILAAILSFPITFGILGNILSVIFGTIGLTFLIIFSTFYGILKSFSLGALMFSYDTGFNLGIFLFSLGLIILILATIYFVIKSIIGVMFFILGKIYKKITFSHKDSEETDIKLEEKIIEFDEIKSIKMDIAIGQIKIIKSNKNYIKCFENDKFGFTKTYNDGKLILDSKLKKESLIYLKGFKSLKLEIGYTAFDMDLEIDNLIGILKLQSHDKLNLNINKLVGEAKVFLDEKTDINCEIDTKVGVLNIEKGIDVLYSKYDRKIRVKTLLGQLVVKKGIL